MYKEGDQGKLDKFFLDYTPYQVIYKGDESGSHSVINLVDVKATLPSIDLEPDRGYAYTKKITGFKPISKTQLSRLLNAQEIETELYHARDSLYISDQNYSGVPGLRISTGTGNMRFKTRVLLDGDMKLLDFVSHVKDKKYIELDGQLPPNIVKQLLKYNIIIEYQRAKYSKGVRARKKREKRFSSSVYMPNNKIRCDNGLWKLIYMLQKVVDKKLLRGKMTHYDVFGYVKQGNAKWAASGWLFKLMIMCDNLKINGYKRTKLWKDFADGLEKCIVVSSNKYAEDASTITNLKKIYEMETGKEYKEKKKKKTTKGVKK